MLYTAIAPDAAKLSVIQEGDSSGFVTGYAAVFNNTDHGGDVIEPGAFAKTLLEGGLRRGNVKLYDSHMIYAGTDAIIGVVEEAEEDNYGLKFRARFSAVSKAQDVRLKIKEGILNALSFGYDVVKYMEDETTKVRRLLELKLYEVSVVPWGMNPQALIDGVKSVGKFEERDVHFSKATRVRPRSEEEASVEEQKAREAFGAFFADVQSAAATAKLIADMKAYRP